MIFGKKRPRVTIQSARKAPLKTAETMYEIIPESYAGPWKLPVGTVLEVVSEPKVDKRAGA